LFGRGYQSHCALPRNCRRKVCIPAVEPQCDASISQSRKLALCKPTGSPKCGDLTTPAFQCIRFFTSDLSNLSRAFLLHHPFSASILYSLCASYTSSIRAKPVMSHHLSRPDNWLDTWLRSKMNDRNLLLTLPSSAYGSHQ
jgi:hypothetical protein